MAGQIDSPSFNLWTEPWITLERPDGGSDRLGIEQTLLRAADYQTIYEPSPLVVVGIQRLLAAILQEALDPQEIDDLQDLWERGHFPPEAIAAFGHRYAGRFDLFSADTPFLQSSDLPLAPAKRSDLKTVAYLYPEQPAGTAMTHYCHSEENECGLCPTCCAGGLLVIAPFATSGGAGIKPSINGVPPLYLLPGGRSVFYALAASLVIPAYQPTSASGTGAGASWSRPSKVGRSCELREVTYLQSLTFAARRVRLHPQAGPAACTRCGAKTQWIVHTMVFEMGESRPKDAPFWRDPFAAYRLPNQGDKKPPTPIRPQAGKAAWREFAALFLQQNQASPGERPVWRPRILDQMAEAEIGGNVYTYPFRCIGLRTDMKAKVFEWVDSVFDVPPALLRDPKAAFTVRDGLRFAEDCAGIINTVFKREIGAQTAQRERHSRLRQRMLAIYWDALATPFRGLILASPSADLRSDETRRWIDEVVRTALAAFLQAISGLGDDAANLAAQAKAESRCRREIYSRREKELQHEQ